MDIKGYDKAAVLAALYNAAQPLGTGILVFEPEPMTTEEARALLDEGRTYFDYVKGRAMKVDMSSDDIDLDPYDSRNGAGAGERAIAAAIPRVAHGTGPDRPADRRQMSTFKESLVKMHSAALASGAAVPPDVEAIINGIDDLDKRMAALPEESRAKILGSMCFGIVVEPLTPEEQAVADELAPLWKWSVAQIAEIPDEFTPR